MRVVPYLNFDGQCAEAFRFYERVLDGKLEAIMTHAESPMANEGGPEWRDLVLHACLDVGGQTIMGSDSPPNSHVKAQGMYVSLHLDRPEEAERIFAALAEGGEIAMPLGPTFWASRFGICADRFGTQWMVNCGVPAEELAAALARE